MTVLHFFLKLDSVKDDYKLASKSRKIIIVQEQEHADGTFLFTFLIYLQLYLFLSFYLNNRSEFRSFH